MCRAPSGTLLQGTLARGLSVSLAHRRWTSQCLTYWSTCWNLMKALLTSRFSSGSLGHYQALNQQSTASNSNITNLHPVTFHLTSNFKNVHCSDDIIELCLRLVTTAPVFPPHQSLSSKFPLQTFLFRGLLTSWAYPHRSSMMVPRGHTAFTCKGTKVQQAPHSSIHMHCGRTRTPTCTSHAHPKRNP